jgi:hypothetical protein
MEPQPRGMGAFSRFAGIFFDPKKTFADIAQRPSWLFPMILMIVLALALTSTISQRVGWERVVRQTLESSSRVQQLPQEQRELAVATQLKFMPASYYTFSVIGPPLYCVIVGAVLLGITAIMSAGLRFKQVFALVAWASMPRALVTILTVVVVFLKNPDEFNIRNPLAFNVGAFMDPNGGSKFAYAVATNLDLFTFWVILLLATGLKVAAGKKISFAGALMAVVVPWVLAVLVLSALASFN